MLFAAGNRTGSLDIQQTVADACDAVCKMVEPRLSLLIIPPDITRFHSMAGMITEHLYRRLQGKNRVTILPATGTHRAMSAEERVRMFGSGIPGDTFIDHNWRDGVSVRGVLETDFMKQVSGGLVEYPVEIALNREIDSKRFDMIISIGQVVPHEVAGMANYTKNIIIGTGGKDCIDKSHYLGAVTGIEKVIGSMDNPVRAMLDTAFERFMPGLPVLFIQTVMGSVGFDSSLHGLYCSFDRSAFEQASSLSGALNITRLPSPVRRAAVWLDPGEFKSTWLGNKAIYRLRRAMADGGVLYVMGPGVDTFGEDIEIDRLIRKYGYCGREQIMSLTTEKRELHDNLSAAAHLIHGSADGRFSVTWCTDPDLLSEVDIRSVGYDWMHADKAIEMLGRIDKMPPGMQAGEDGQELYIVHNPGSGLWTW